MSQYSRDALEKACLVLKRAMLQGRVGIGEAEFRMYQETDVKEVILDVFQPVFRVHVFQEDEVLYVVPSDAQSLIYKSDQVRREAMKLRDQDELHLADFCAMVLGSVFYNSSAHSRPTRAVIGLSEWFHEVDRNIEKWTQEYLTGRKEELEAQELQTEINITGIVEKWHRMRLKEGAETYRASRSEKISFLKKVAQHLQEEGLVQFYDERELAPTEKWSAIMSKHYGMLERKEYITNLLA
ncbi:hypothetical protein BAG01nite_45350 [Brevibacillus agri]|uniref:Non-ribosomal peptide synthetase module n=1 Tax=Brevibacillus agri TaxID=51101 RepID=A0A3M8A566_9BACL|nr:DUF6063 family protein [Brevibacillus agri]ELK39631.1 hypothetical protein D478_23303 [Brevibacillus agri BAB-2500]MBY0053344.1 hypothetical protein [Brevibacillus agri]QAV11872.1 hypothetical protein BA6348_03345 [Brevibacillus agri]RNB46359.1 hypothetical protein EB820_25140 [Brevibacillus agri]GED28433.1 hypothetical protein BAG01nite_45350 [Brevibacillus agri]